MSKKTGTSYDAHPFRIEWLPNGNTQRTKTAKTVTELIPYYYRFNKKSRILWQGEKPGFIPANKIFTQKEWRSHISQSNKKTVTSVGITDDWALSRTCQLKMVFPVTIAPKKRLM